ncbi:MAG: NAD-dependent epimerase/dehydratase [Bacteriovoracaceae bacterium]|nr:NAD-dependent epimerase/dehydratase [Bacteriovoracaceae bacterium]
MKERILITGGAGFIGSHLAKKLTASGYSVRVLDLFTPQVHGNDGFQKSLPSFSRDIEVMHGDVRSPKDIRSALHHMDVVYHLAASVGVGQSMYEVHSYTSHNNLGTANLLQQLIARPIQKLIVASSMSLYGEGSYVSSDGKIHHSIRRNFAEVKQRKWEPQLEDGEPLVPIMTPESKAPDLSSIYALSKYDQERMCHTIGQAYNIPTVSLRFFNVYGRGQSLSNPYTGVMAIFASRLLNGSTPTIFEDGNQMRDFVHVSDVVEACQLALEIPEAAGEVFNIGSGSHFRIQEIARAMAKMIGVSLEPEITEHYRVGDIRHCFADISKAKRLLGYRPKVNLTEGLADLTQWLAEQTAIDHTKRARHELYSRGLAL